MGIIYKEESAKIVGAIFEVHKRLGVGLPDFVCYDKIIVELKAVNELLDVHKAQVRNYLTITGYELGILCNFNELYMEPVRVLNSNLK